MGVSEDGIDTYIYISPNGQSYREDDDELWDFGVPPTCMCFFFFSATIETNDREDSSLDTWFGTCPMLISKIL